MQHVDVCDPSKNEGNIPASSSSSWELVVVIVPMDLTHYGICKDEFELEVKVKVKVKEVPCKHVYYVDSILLWLNQPNACPV